LILPAVSSGYYQHSLLLQGHKMGLSVYKVFTLLQKNKYFDQKVMHMKVRKSARELVFRGLGVRK
ncbi:MAG TPA: hypothetical protein PL128_01530, partial [Ginsengibacter sp.]|nr:hypothetical protein [Ginsengibacter sp.]